MPAAELQSRNPASFRDPSGFVFELDGRVFRAVGSSCLDTTRRLHQQGLLGELIEAGAMIPTEIIGDAALAGELDRAHPGSSGFLEHRRIEFISYPYEWSPAMLADAGLATLDLQARLLKQGYSLKDATAYNLQFVNGRPVFIDLGSIERPSRLDLWIALGQFGRMFTLPLILNRSKGHSLRSYFLANLDGSDVAEVRRAFGRLELLRPTLLLDVALPYWLGRRTSGATEQGIEQGGQGATSPAAQLLNLRRLRSKLIKLRGSDRSAGGWADYDARRSYSAAADRSKMDAVRQFLSAHQPASVLDLGCNTGRYSLLAADAGAKVVAVDNDVDCIDRLYRQVSGSKRPVLPLCVDIANPSPGIGFCNRERPSFLQRIQADCILALALIHHLHVAHNLPFAGIRDMFSDLARKYLVLEFIPAGDIMFRRLTRFRTASFEEFTLERCIATFGERFDLISAVPVADSLRTLLFFRKR